MSYYRQRYYSRPETIPASPELSARLERVAGELHCHLTDWEQGFVESISEAYKKYSGLTVGQHTTFEKIEKKYDPETLAAKASWADNFNDEKRAILKLVTNYYRSTGYFSNLVARIDSDSDYVPDENTWKKFVENKYAKKVLAVQSNATNFASGGFALLRDTFLPRSNGFWGSADSVGRSLPQRKGRPVLVLRESDRLSTDRVWTCAYLDNPTAMWEIEERWLKRYRPSKKKG